MSGDTKPAQMLAPVSVLLLLLFGSMTALAQQSPPYSRNENTSASTKSKITDPDQRFVKQAWSGGVTEMKLGQLAEQKGMSQAVKEFGMRMVDDHGKADGELKTAAREANDLLPRKISKKEQATYNRLSKLSGAEFDREYAKAMVDNHTQDLAAFRKEADTGKDEIIRKFAEESLPALEDHLKLAHQMQSALTRVANSAMGSSYD